jgi:hypothetical protein
MEIGETILAIFVAILLLGSGFLVGLNNGSTTEVISEKVIVENTVLNNTDVLKAIESLQKDLEEVENWEDEAKNIAEEDLSTKDIYKALVSANLSIVERADIESFEVTDTEVLSSDFEDKDAVVLLEVKVYYEDSSGDRQKVYLEVETTIEDSEVEDTVITLI